MMQISNLPLQKQFYTIIIGTVCFFILVSFTFNIYATYRYKKESFLYEGELQASLIADNSLAPIMFFDKEGANKNLQTLKQYENIVQVLILDNDKNIFSIYNIRNKNILYEIASQEAFSIFQDTYIFQKDIADNGIIYGTLYLQKNLQPLKDFLYKAFTEVLIFSTFLAAFMIITVVKVSNIFVTPIINLSTKLKYLSKTQNYNTQLTSKWGRNSKNEIAQLYESFNTLFKSILSHQESRDKALLEAQESKNHLELLTDQLEDKVKERTKELEESLEFVKKAQNQLVESEKMAALGTLVSGVAHEVNTPLGNAVTGSTIISNECEDLQRMVSDGTLKKSVLEEKVQNITQTSALLYKSIHTAADLIRSFKRISVDQSVEHKREFDIHEYTDEIFRTFKNKLKQIPVAIEFIHEGELTISSYPGIYAQIFNNFIQNSILHGFEHKKDNAKITVNIYKTNNTLNIIYSDNGSGVSEDMQNKIFDPFVTTKRNQGGTGLGLNIVYNLVTQKLHGKISLDSNLDEGVTFTISIPLEEEES